MRTEAGEQIGPDIQRRHEEYGRTQVPIKSLYPFCKQRPELREGPKVNDNARGSSNKKAEVSAPSTRSDVEGCPIYFHDSTWSCPSKEGDLGVKGGSRKRAE